VSSSWVPAVRRALAPTPPIVITMVDECRWRGRGQRWSGPETDPAPGEARISHAPPPGLNSRPDSQDVGLFWAQVRFRALSARQGAPQGTPGGWLDPEYQPRGEGKGDGHRQVATHVGHEGRHQFGDHLCLASGAAGGCR